MKDHTSTTRRSFFRKAGAAVAVPLAFGAGTAAASDAGADDLEARVKALESRDAIRALHDAFLQRLNSGETDALRALSTHQQQAGPDCSITRLLQDHAAGHGDSIIVAADGHHATASFSCIARIATPVAADGTLADMMRLQGSDQLQREERGVLDGHYVNVGGHWQIERIAYRRA